MIKWLMGLFGRKNKDMDNTKSTIIKVLNVFENDSCSPNTEYDKIYCYFDGPNETKQVTLARGFTESGSLWDVIQQYKDNGGVYGDKLLSYKSQAGKQTLPNNQVFKDMLVAAGKEKAMTDAQDLVYDKLYWSKGVKWAKDNGFVLPLSLLVIQDSMLQSGSILDLLRKRFPAKTPANGGDEKEWITEYVTVRHEWLKNHTRKVLNNTIYRTQFLKDQIARNNWDLETFPIYPHGVKVTNA